MAKKIGNFSIEENEEAVSLHYTLSKKDWLDFVIKLVMAILTLLIGFLFFYKLTSKSIILEVVIGIVFILFGCIFLIDAVSLIIRVKRNIVRVLKKENILVHRKTLFTSDTYKLQDIKAFIVSGKNEQAYFNRKSVRRLYGIIELQLSNNILKPVLIINSKRVFQDSGNISIESEIQNEAKNIVKELNKSIKAKYQFENFKIENF
ncbi:hypothetical protein NZD88_03615 [Chryseobacterium antibioticum]|uniref:DUF304 domain-containing protein n=1 Tax=Chryseobacterium pyrolae TaxID=2987481 RepID=A0ABT2IE47_9FLAO|nr:hypothetical protein [Chryseobacterium pyrolae]MCT2406643.1 hypothetical protein [Chryseobacterium pyrolae]